MTDVQGGSDLIESGLPVGGGIDFLRLIWAVDHALQRRSKSMAATLGITGPQRLVIRIIGRFRASTRGNWLTFCTCTPVRSRPS